MPHVPTASARPGRLVLLCLCLALAVPGASAALAMEGGVSHYIQGAYGDFMMGYVPGPGPYLRNDTFFQSARNSDFSLKGGRVYGEMQNQMFMNLTKLSYMTEVPAIGGLMGMGVVIPVIFNESITGSISADYVRGSYRTKQFREGHIEKAGGGERGGLSDVILMPLIMAWNLGECHIMVSPLVYLPTGYYNPHILTNLGMNYLSFDGNVAFTWLSHTGLELSFNAGYMLSTQNEATQYQSGQEFHFDWTAAFHPTERLSFGAVGYLYAQTTPDTGSGARLGAYMSQSAGIGPAISYAATLGGVNVLLESKWLHDVAAQNRMTGDMVYGSFAVKF